MSQSTTKRQHPVKLPSDSDSSLGAALAPHRTSAGDAFSWVALQVLQLHGLLIEAGDAMAAPMGQTSARWQVLAALEETPRSVAQIARAMNQARQSVQRIGDLLAKEGFAIYEDNPAHQRAKLLRLTPAGLASLRGIQASQRVWADTLGAAVGEEPLRNAGAVLGQLLQTLQSPGTDPDAP